jgi:hypothetical protein
MNDKKPIPVPAHLINPLAGYYIPARDNPPAPVRPGAEDNKLHKSLPAQGHATYRRHHL